MSPTPVQREIEKRSKAMWTSLRDHISARADLCIVKAPPGSGKTHTLLAAVAHALENGERVAVAAQTNAQANDICKRLLDQYPGTDVVRFASSAAEPPPDLDGRLPWITSGKNLPHEPCIVVATTAKWALVQIPYTFDVVVVDEAWQMAWADCMLLGLVAPRFVLIGDPGQIPPVVTIEVDRWETSPRGPHMAAPEVLLADPTVKRLELDLPACRRLPEDSVSLVLPFYDFEFLAWAQPGERYIKVGRPRNGTHPSDAVWSLLGPSASAAIITLPTPAGGPPFECDEELAEATADVALRLLERGAFVADGDGLERKLKPSDIGITATHRVMNSAMLESLPHNLRNQTTGIRVDTPERWQGLERPVMIMVHPLSGVVHPSAFDLETGRLCVMASRHKSALVVVSRDHVVHTLENHIPSAEQAVGRPDVTGKGHDQHLIFWKTLADRGLVVGAA